MSQDSLPFATGYKAMILKMYFNIDWTLTIICKRKHANVMKDIYIQEFLLYHNFFISLFTIGILYQKARRNSSQTIKISWHLYLVGYKTDKKRIFFYKDPPILYACKIHSHYINSAYVEHCLCKGYVSCMHVRYEFPFYKWTRECVPAMYYIINY